MMRGRVLAALAAVLAVGAALALPLLPSRQGGGWREYAPGKVAALAVRGGAGEYALRARDGGWVLDAPGLARGLPADPQRVAALVEFLGRNRPLGHTDDPGAARTGLGAGRGLLVDGADFLEIGATDRDGARVFARRGAGGPVLLLPGEYARVLERPAEYYLDLRLVDLDPARVERVTLVRGGAGGGAGGARAAEVVEMVRRPGGPVFVRPGARAGQPVSVEELDLWLHELAGLRALGPAPGGAAPPGPGADLRVELRLRGAGVHSLALFSSARGPWTAVCGPRGIHFLLDPGQAAKVDRNAFSFADRRLAALDPGAVDRLVLSASGQRLHAERDGRRWRGQGLPGRLTGIDMLLWRLSDLRYEAGPQATPPPGARERLRLELGLRDGARREFVFHIDPGLPPGRCWISCGDRPDFYRVHDQFYKDLKGFLPPAPEAGSNRSARTHRVPSVAKGDTHGQNHC
jgi:hypothetical protein